MQHPFALINFCPHDGNCANVFGVQCRDAFRVGRDHWAARAKRPRQAPRGSLLPGHLWPPAIAKTTSRDRGKLQATLQHSWGVQRVSSWSINVVFFTPSTVVMQPSAQVRRQISTSLSCIRDGETLFDFYYYYIVNLFQLIKLARWD